MKMSTLLTLLKYWPPYFGAGIRVKKVSADVTSIEVEMKFRFWNKNYVGTQFGGSLYSMIDPFYMIILLENLGKNYIVWDKAASIRFEKPAKSRVHASFYLSKEEIESLRIRADREGKIEPQFTVQIFDDAGEVVATAEKTIYIRNKESIKNKSNI
jgi:hypothetical protein